MDLLSYVQIIKRRLGVIVTTTIVAVLVAVAGSLLIPQPVNSTSTLRIIPPQNAAGSTIDRVMNTFVSIAESRPIKDEVYQQLGLDPTYELDVSVSQVPNSEILEITVKDPDPVLAQSAALAYSQTILNARTITDVRVVVIEAASAPEPPSLTGLILVYILTGIVGLVAGVGLAFLIDNLDTRVHSSDVVEEITGLPVIGEIPRAPETTDDSLFLIDRYPYTDAFLRLRTNLLSVDGEIIHKVIMVTSAEPMDGKSTLISNIGRGFGQAGFRTIILDADFYSPTLSTLFSLENGRGLSQVLAGDLDLVPVIQKTGFRNLDLIPSGPSPQVPADLLKSDQMRRIFTELSHVYDLVLIDTPPVLGVVDGLILAPLTEAVVLVSNFQKTAKSSLVSCVQQLKRVKSNLIGVVVNQTRLSSPRFYYPYPGSSDRGVVSPPPAPKKATEITKKKTSAPPESKKEKESISSLERSGTQYGSAWPKPEDYDLPAFGVNKKHMEEGQDSDTVESERNTTSNANARPEKSELAPRIQVTNLKGQDIGMQNSAVEKSFFSIFSDLAIYLPARVSRYLASKMAARMVGRKRWREQAKSFINDEMT
jgi:polysaccharide biosynthesis transport protein